MAEFISLLFYLAMFSLSTLLFSFYNRKGVSRALRRASLTLSMLIPSVMAGARYQVGSDWTNYEGNITLIRNTPMRELFQSPSLARFEYGYRLLIKLLSYCLNNRFIFGAVAFLTLFFIVKSLTEDYKEEYISVAYFVYLLNYFSNSFNIMRQTLALSIVFWAMRYIYKGDFRKYALWILIAMSFHVSAIFAAPIYFFWNGKKRRAIKLKRFAPILLAAFIVVIFWRRAMSFLILHGVPFVSKFAGYLNDNNARNRDFYLKTAVFLFLMILYLVSKRRTQRQKLFLEMSAINLLIGLTGFYITFIKRAGLYYEITGILLVSSMIKYFSRDSKLVAAIIIEAVTAAYFTLVYYILGQSGIIPYRIA